MMMVMTERELPADFDVSNDDEVARYCRYAVNAIAQAKGEVHWLGTYATDDKRLFGLLAVESQEALAAYLKRAGVQGPVKIRRIARRLDPSLAAPNGN